MPSGYFYQSPNFLHRQGSAMKNVKDLLESLKNFKTNVI